MSLLELKKRKIEAIQLALNQHEGFQFSEGLIQAFQVDGEIQTECNLIKQNDSCLSEPIIIIKDSIQPIIKNRVNYKQVQIIEKEEVLDIDLEAVTRLLDSLNVFTLSSSQISSESKTAALHNLVHLTLSNLKEALASIDFKTWPDDNIADLFKEIAEAEHMPSANTTLFINAVYYTKVADLKSTSPRLLMDSIISIAKQEGKSAMEGLILPLLFQSDLARPQYEVMIKIINESLNSSQRLMLLQQILSDGEIYFSNNENIALTSRKYLRPWNEGIVTLMNSILSTQPFVLLNNTCLFDLIQPIQTLVQSNPKDKGSMQLLLLLTSKYAQTLVECDAIDIIECICQSSTMFLKRSVLGQIASIKKNLQSIQKSQ